MKMRYFSSVALVAALVAACDSPLDTNPTDRIDAGSALTTARGIELALIGAYAGLQSDDLYDRVEMGYSDLYSGDLDFTGTFTADREVSVRAIQPTNGDVGGIWSSSFDAINRVNNVLDALATVSDPALTDALKTQYRGEALWLRGLMYSILAKYFGGVPLVDQPSRGVGPESNVSRASLQETYAFIVKDLEEAATLLPPTRNNGKATQAAVNALLARVYLEDGKYTQAREKATAVINNNNYRLAPTYREIFTTKNSVESIYEVQFTVNNRTQLPFFFFPTTLGGRYGWAPSLALFNAYEAGDARRAASIAISPQGQRYGFKYFRISTRDDNAPVLRLAEQYLIRAEANARLNAPAATVQADINVVRNRAGLANLPLTVTSQAALLDAILQERRVELAMEGFRFMDLRRHGKAEAVLGIPATKLLWPVPQADRDTNPNLAQNPGY